MPGGTLDQDRDELFVMSDLFSNNQWNDMVIESAAQVSVDAEGRSGPRVEAAASAQLQPLQRQSVDQDVLQQMIIDRARRLAMRAVADVLSDIAGPIASRVYIQELARASSELLVDRTGMQNTLVEDLVAVIVRTVLADAIVRSRFSGDKLTNACRWRTSVHEGSLPEVAAVRGETAAAHEARLELACRGQPIAELATACAETSGANGTSAERPAHCALTVRRPNGRLAAFIPSRIDAEETTRLRAYLTDLAYWSLGQTSLFARRTRVPDCAFDEGHPYRPLCGYIAGARDDDDRRARRISALLGTSDLITGLDLARDLLGMMRPPGHLRLSAIVDAYAERPKLGSFARSAVLNQAADDNFYADLADWADLWIPILQLAKAARAFADDRTPGTPETLPAFRAAAEAAKVAMRRCSIKVGPSIMPTAALCGIPRMAPGSPPPPPPRPPPGPPIPGCPAPERTLERFISNLPGRIDNAAIATSPYERIRALCVSPQFSTLVSRPNEFRRVDERIALLGSLRDAANDAKAAAESVSGYRARPELSLGTIPLEAADSFAAKARDLAAPLQAIDALLRRTVLTTLMEDRNFRAHADATFLPTLRRSIVAIRGVARLVSLVAALDQHALHARGILNVTDVMAAIRGLASGGSLLLSRIGPVLQYMRPGHPLTIESMLLMLEEMNVEDIVVALGVAERRENWCADEEGGLPCWTQRIIMVIREATDVSRDQVSIDANRIVKTLGAMGDDFRRRTAWRWYFHLTIGLGEMLSFLPAGASPTGAEQRRFVPIMAEQIGLGYASPSFLGDRFAVRVGIFGSGLLYRAVLDSTESDAFMFGGFFAIDAYELLEFFVAPQVLVYPPGDGSSSKPSFAISAGAAIPLGDYLSSL